LVDLEVEGQQMGSSTQSTVDKQVFSRVFHMYARVSAAALAAASLTLAGAADAAILSGDVSRDGKPVRGALVTLMSADQLTHETVLSNSSGHYSLATQLSGDLTLRARAALSADATASIAVPTGAATLNRSFALRPLTTAQEISDSLPASAHFARIKFPTLIERQQFQTDCLSCHQVGNALTRKVREPVVWQAFLKVMTAFAGYTSDVHVADYSQALGAAFDGKPIVAAERSAIDEAALSARITEWRLPGAQLAHDTELNPHNGKFYTVDEGVDQVLITDPKNNQTTSVPIPDLGVPEGGRFGEMKLPIPFNQTNRHGVHSLQMGADGKFYMTEAIASSITVFDPATNKFEPHIIPGKTLYPHTLRIDRKGMVWFTIQVSNQFGRYNPKTQAMTVIELPTDMARKDERSPVPYGVDVSPIDGSIWYTKLWANKIGRLDPKTLTVKEWVPPVIGPRRARFDATGGLWIPGFGDGKIARLDTKTMKYDIYTIPTLADDEVEAPYALAVDPKTQDVWITANMSDRMFRFEPKTKRFTAYPLPVRGVYFRDVVFAGTSVCASNNPMGPLTEIVEGGMDSVICLDPIGNRTGT
jgi:virginiamycin B lyase